MCVYQWIYFLPVSVSRPISSKALEVSDVGCGDDCDDAAADIDGGDS